MDARVAPELTVALEQRAELHAFGVAEEPGGIMILLAVDGGHANCDVKSAAMPPKTAAWWRRQENSREKRRFLVAETNGLMAARPVSHYVVAARVGADNRGAARGQRRANSNGCEAISECAFLRL